MNYSLLLLMSAFAQEFFLVDRWQQDLKRVSDNYNVFVRAQEAFACSHVVSSADLVNRVSYRSQNIKLEAEYGSQKADTRLDGSVVPSDSREGLLHTVSGGRYFGYNEKRHRGRVFNRVITGLKIAHVRGERTRFLTLSTHTGYDKVNLSADLETFFNRCEHANFEVDGFNPFHAVFVKVTTDEGNGVIHCIFKAVPVKRSWRQAKLFSRVRKRKGGLPVNHKFDVGYLPFEWIKVNWADITENDDSRTQNVYIKQTYGSPKAIAGYLIQYVSGQDSLRRLSYSKDWLYRGCVKDWNSHFKPKVAELYSYRCSLDDEIFDDEMRAIYRDWDKWIFHKVG
jgi:hypothetical protein